MKKDNHFDLLRLVAALGVMITHAYTFVGLPEQDILYRFTDGRMALSKLALYTFFTISGFLVTQSLMRSTSVSGFIIKRIIRIMPALIVVIFFSVLILGPLMTTFPFQEYITHPQTWRYLGNISILDQPVGLPGVFENNPLKDFVNGSLWTLKYELICYTSLVFIFLFIKPAHRLFTILLTVIFISALAFRTFYEQPLFNYIFPYFGLTGRHTFVFGLMFLAGVIAALHRDRIVWSLPAAFSLAIVWFSLKNPILSSLLTHLVIPYVILTIGQKTSPLTRLTKWGDFSYGLYIYAFPISQSIVFLADIKSMPLFALLSILFTLPFAITSWFFIEKPALSLKARLAR